MLHGRGVFRVTRHVIGIDPGVSSGIAVVTLEPVPKLVNHLAVRVDRELPSHVLDGLCGHDIAAVAIESQYVSVNVASALRLAQIAGRWEEAVLAFGGLNFGQLIGNQPLTTLFWVKPNEWQSHMLSGFVGRRTKRDARKKAAKTIALMRWGVKLETDVADAALIAAFQAERLAFKGMR